MASLSMVLMESLSTVLIPWMFPQTNLSTGILMVPTLFVLMLPVPTESLSTGTHVDRSYDVFMDDSNSVHVSLSDNVRVYEDKTCQ